MGRKEDFLPLREQGMTYKQIADRFGVSYQNVQQVCAKANPALARVVTPKMCAYPGLRNWMNGARISKAELNRILHNGYYAGNQNSVELINSKLRGETSFKMKEINAIIDRSGLTYEQLFLEREA